MQNINRTASRLTALCLIPLSSGCTTIPLDLGRSDVDQLVSERGLPVENITEVSRRSLIDALTREPLSAENAIRIALINNPELQAEYATLGFAAADIYEAGRIRNPIFSASILDSNQSGDLDLETFGLVVSFTDLLTLSARKRLAKAEFAGMKQTIGASVLNTAADAESAYYNFVTAKQVAALRTQIAKAGRLSFDLAKRFSDAGNLTPRELAASRAAASAAQVKALGAQGEAFRARTELAAVLGLSVGGAWEAPAQLPVALEREDKLDDLLVLARSCRLDLAAAHTRADLIADRAGVTNWTRWLGDLDIGVERERETDGAKLTGPTLEWEVPVFTQHRDALLRVDAELKIAVIEVARLTRAIENGVRLAYAAANNARARVTEYSEQLIPARVNVVERAQEEENFMLIGIFEVLEMKQEEYSTYHGYLETVRDYWIARVDLAREVGNTLPSSANIGHQQINADQFIAPGGGGKHMGHGAMGSRSDQPEGGHSDHKMTAETPDPHAEHANNGDKE